jgi:hypothetical protein
VSGVLASTAVSFPLTPGRLSRNEKEVKPFSAREKGWGEESRSFRQSLLIASTMFGSI